MLTKTKILGLSGIAASLITTFLNVATQHSYFAQILMGVGGVVIYCVDHAKTLAQSFHFNAKHPSPVERTAQEVLERIGTIADAVNGTSVVNPSQSQTKGSK